MGTQETNKSGKWQNLLSTLPELKAELLQQQAALRTERSAALVDFALDKTPANRAKLDNLSKRLASINDTLADLEVTLEEALHEVEQAAEIPNAESQPQRESDVEADYPNGAAILVRDMKRDP